MKLKRCLLLLAALATVGCPGPAAEEPQQVIAYVALDSEFSQPVLDRFQEQSDIEVLAKFDVEATKTVGLAELLIAEAQRPRCDVFWNNEIMHTLRLEKLGLLEPYSATAGQAYPAAFRSPRGYWYGFAARARILIVNTDWAQQHPLPTSVLDLTDPQHRGQIGIAKPLFGTTATHAACLFAAWGDERAKDFFSKLKANDVQILSGNRQVAAAVASGQLAFGLTDTDDALLELQAGRPVKIVFPDGGQDGLGTLLIPNTIAVLKRAPHPQAGRQLVEFVLSAATEKVLAQGPSGQIPLRTDVRERPPLHFPADYHPMKVDFYAAAELWPEVSRWLRDEFTAE